jgi:hypothetical protein
MDLVAALQLHYSFREALQLVKKQCFAEEPHERRLYISLPPHCLESLAGLLLF